MELSAKMGRFENVEINQKNHMSNVYRKPCSLTPCSPGHSIPGDKAKIVKGLTEFLENMETTAEKNKELSKLENENRRLVTTLDIWIEPNFRLYEIKRLKNVDAEYQIIENYFVKSQVRAHHTMYDVASISLIDIYKVKTFNHHVSKLNNLLLWHGTKEELLPMIIYEGLKITNNNSRTRMFGNGIYFADRVTKSMQYVESTTGNGFDQGYHKILLCEVFVGNEYRQFRHDHHLNSPPIGYDSVKGVGRYIPDPNGNLNIEGSIVPAGHTILNQSVFSELKNNEYVIYDNHQGHRIQVKYIVLYEVNKCKIKGRIINWCLRKTGNLLNPLICIILVFVFLYVILLFWRLILIIFLVVFLLDSFCFDQSDH